MDQISNERWAEIMRQAAENVARQEQPTVPESEEPHKRKRSTMREASLSIDRCARNLNRIVIKRNEWLIDKFGLAAVQRMDETLRLVVVGERIIEERVYPPLDPNHAGRGLAVLAQGPKNLRHISREG